MGNFFVWNIQYETGIGSVDEQHKRLVSYLNELYKRSIQSMDNEGVKEILLKLVEYTQIHFRDEEQLMLKYEYSGTEIHEEEHKHFEEEVTKFLEDVQNGYPITFQLIAFLKDWLREHILGSDMELTKAIKHKKAIA